MPAVVNAATKTQPSAPAAAYGTTSSQPIAQPGVFAATTVQLTDTVSMYTTTLSGVAGPVPTYAVTDMKPPASAPMYLATASQAVDPSTMLDSKFELLNGGRGDFSGVLQALDELEWLGVTIHRVLNALPKVYKEYREGIHCEERGCALTCRLL